MSRLDLKFWEDGTRRRHLFFFFFKCISIPTHKQPRQLFSRTKTNGHLQQKTGNSISPQSTKIQAAGVNWLQPQGQLVLSV